MIKKRSCRNDASNFWLKKKNPFFVASCCLMLCWMLLLLPTVMLSVPVKEYFIMFTNVALSLIITSIRDVYRSFPWICRFLQIVSDALFFLHQSVEPTPRRNFCNWLFYALQPLLSRAGPLCQNCWHEIFCIYAIRSSCLWSCVCYLP